MNSSSTDFLHLWYLKKSKSSPGDGGDGGGNVLVGVVVGSYGFSFVLKGFQKKCRDKH